MTTCPNGHVVFESDSDCRQCGWSPLPAAGWYPDVTNDGGERYWDGTQWTDHFRNLLVEPASEEVASPQAEPVPEEEIVDSAQIESENPALTEEVATTAPALQMAPIGLMPGLYPFIDGSLRYWTGESWQAPFEVAASQVAGISAQVQVQSDTKSGGRWRVWVPVLLGIAVACQAPFARDFLQFYTNANLDLWMSTKVATACLVLSVIATVVALILAAVGKRFGAVTAVSIALVTNIVQLVAWIAGNMQGGATLGEALIANLKSTFLGININSNDEAQFWPSYFLAGTVTWILLITSLIVLLASRSNSQQPSGAITSPVASLYNPAYGQPNPYVAAAQPQTSVMAVLALIFTFLLWPVGLILGYVARKEIDNSNGMKTGRGMATASIVLGWIGLVGIILAFILFVAASSQSGT